MSQRSANPRQVTSLYLDDAAASTLNGALARASGGPGRVADLLSFAEQALHGISRYERTLAEGYAPELAEKGESWLRIPSDALHDDLTPYKRTWQEAMRAWHAKADLDDAGLHMLALAALTHRSSAWAVPPREPAPFPFAFKPRRKDAPLHGPFPKHVGDPSPEIRLASTQRILRQAFKSRRLELQFTPASSPHSVAVDRVAHALTRRMIGSDVLDWLVRHWARRFDRAPIRKWADAPLYASMGLRDDVHLAHLPFVLQALERTRLDFIGGEWPRSASHEPLEHEVRLLSPSGATPAARTADAYDVTFYDFDGDAGFAAVEIPASVDLEAVGVLVMAKRLGVLDDPDLDLADAAQVRRRMASALGIETSADARTWTDALLATIDAMAPEVTADTAAAWHADRVLDAYLGSRGATATSFVARLARGSVWAWPDRWALHRYMGFPLDSPLDDSTWWTKKATGRLPLATIHRLNRILAHLAGPDTRGPWWGIASAAQIDIDRKGDEVTINLDAGFVEEAVRLARGRTPSLDAARALLKWGLAR